MPQVKEQSGTYRVLISTSWSQRGSGAWLEQTPACHTSPFLAGAAHAWST